VRGEAGKASEWRVARLIVPLEACLTLAAHGRHPSGERRHKRPAAEHLGGERLEWPSAIWADERRVDPLPEGRAVRGVECAGPEETHVPRHVYRPSRGRRDRGRGRGRGRRRRRRRHRRRRPCCSRHRTAVCRLYRAARRAARAGAGRHTRAGQHGVGTGVRRVRRVRVAYSGLGLGLGLGLGFGLGLGLAGQHGVGTGARWRCALRAAEAHDGTRAAHERVAHLVEVGVEIGFGVG
jgi:hypothetical protein